MDKAPRPLSSFERNARVMGAMRRHYGPILQTEPNMRFYGDGSAVVTGSGQTHHLAKEQVEAFAARPTP